MYCKVTWGTTFQMPARGITIILTPLPANPNANLNPTLGSCLRGFRIFLLVWNVLFISLLERFRKVFRKVKKTLKSRRPD